MTPITEYDRDIAALRRLFDALRIRLAALEDRLERHERRG